MSGINHMKFFEKPELKKFFTKLYSDKDINVQISRYKNLAKEYIEKFGNEEIQVFSAPGRTEIIGNHTDHNNGKVLTASVNLDCIGIASKNDERTVNIYDITYKEDLSIDIDDIEKVEGEKGTVGLIKGILAGFKKYGYEIGGFNACITSNVIKAAGVSSSAAFEMNICAMINSFYNNEKIDRVTYAKIGKYAENLYWDKKSGLLDQMASAIGGMISIDFKNLESPVVKEINFDFEKIGYSLLIVNTGKNHADLSQEYSSIPYEMKAIAEYLNKGVCREINETNLLNKIGNIRTEFGDRAVLRVMHFLEENRRVESIIEAIKEIDIRKIMNLINESGNSSWKWLQNPRLKPP